MNSNQKFNKAAWELNKQFIVDSYKKGSTFYTNAKDGLIYPGTTNEKEIKTLLKLKRTTGYDIQKIDTEVGEIFKLIFKHKKSKTKNFYEDPIFIEGKIVNTPEEEKFCNEVSEATGIDVKRVFISLFKTDETEDWTPPFNKPYFYIDIRLLSKDNEFSDMYIDSLERSGSVSFNIVDDDLKIEKVYEAETYATAEKAKILFEKYLLNNSIQKKCSLSEFNTTDKNYHVSVISLFFHSERVIFNRSYPVVEKVIKKAAGEKSLISIGVSVKDNKLVTFIAYDSYELFERDKNPQRRAEYKRLAFAELKKFDFFDFISYDRYEIIYKMKYELTYSEKCFLWEKVI